MSKKQEIAKTVILSAAKDLLKGATAFDGRFFARGLRMTANDFLIYRNSARYSSG